MQVLSVNHTKKAIVVGASSGIGEALALVLAKNGYEVGLVARRQDVLLILQKKIVTKSYVKRVDVADVTVAREQFQLLIQEMGKVDLVVLNAGVGIEDQELDWKVQEQMIQVNVLGFSALAQASIDYFKQQRCGHLVGISSVLQARGMPGEAVYCATKSYVSTLLQGIRATLAVAEYNDIYVTDIRPGYVNTDMIKEKERAFWMITASDAAEGIYDAIKNKKHVSYVGKRWFFVALGMRILPGWLLKLFR